MLLKVYESGSHPDDINRNVLWITECHNGTENWDKQLAEVISKMIVLIGFFIRMAVVPMRILIHMMVMPIKIFILLMAKNTDFHDWNAIIIHKLQLYFWGIMFSNHFCSIFYFFFPWQFSSFKDRRLYEFEQKRESKAHQLFFYNFIDSLNIFHVLL